MHCHWGTNNRAPRWTSTDPCKAEVRPGAREESASPAWLAAPAMNYVQNHFWFWVFFYQLQSIDIERECNNILLDHKNICWYWYLIAFCTFSTFDIIYLSRIFSIIMYTIKPETDLTYEQRNMYTFTFHLSKLLLYLTLDLIYSIIFVKTQLPINRLH